MRPAPLRRVGIILALLLPVPTVAFAGDRPLREATSENGELRLRVQPGHGGRPARAELLRRRGQSGERVWRGALVNEAAPQHAAIRNDGKFVVTLDEFRLGGARHALVIYDERGKLLHDLALRDLLAGDEWAGVRAADDAVIWLDNPRFAFVEGVDQFRVRTGPRTEIVIDLPTGKRVNAPRGGATVMSPAVAALLDKQARSASAGELGSEDLDSLDRGDLLQRALELSRAGQPLSPELAALLLAMSGRVPEDALAGDNPEALRGALSNTAGNSLTVGVAVPMPLPGGGTDYPAWVQAFTQTGDDAAVQEYNALIDTCRGWPGDDRAGLRAALRGDPDALAAPEVAQWLSENQTALAHLRAANALDYRGWPLSCSDGMLISAMLPSLSSVREISSAVVIEGRLLEQQGFVGAALDDYFEAYRSGAQVGQGVTLIEKLVGLSVQRMATDAILDALDAPDGSAIDYAALADRLERETPTTREIAQCVQFERAMLLDVVAHTFLTGGDQPDINPKLLSEVAELVGEDATPALDQQVQKLQEIGFEQTVAQANAHYDELTSQLLKPHAQRDLGALERSTEQLDNPLLRSLLPSLGRAIEIDESQEASRRGAILTARILAYRQQTGALPESLDVFGNASYVTDPLTGQAYRYERDGADFRLYSLGTNGVDDGGAHGERIGSPDIRFWPRPRPGE